MDTDWEAHSPNFIKSTWMFKTLPLLWITHTIAASNCRDNEKVTILFQEKPKTKNCSISVAPTCVQFFSSNCVDTCLVTKPCQFEPFPLGKKKNLSML